MVETPTPATEESHRTAKKRSILAIIALIGAIVAGLAAFTDNVGKLGINLHSFCQYLNLCDSSPLPTPVLPGYDSGKMGGGHNQGEQCGPLLEKYRAENPKFTINVQSWEDSDKDFLGHVTYRYHCRYSAVPK